MSQKEIVDNYIKNNYSEIIKLKEDPSFRWKYIGEKIQKSNKTLKGFNAKYLGDYTRRRFDIFKFNLENNIVTDYTNYKQPFCAEYKENREKGIAELKVEVDRNNLTDKEIYEKYNVNSNEYKISQIWYKDKSNGGYVMSVLFTSIKAKEENIDITKSFDKFIDSYNKSILNSERFKTPEQTNNEKAMYLCTLADLHIGNYQKPFYIENIKNKIFSTFDNISDSAIDKIVILNTGDLIHTDTSKSQTWNNTQLDSQDSYEDAFSNSLELLTNLIEYAANKAFSVTFINVRGNHSFDTEYCLGEALKKIYSKNKNIEIINSKDTRIYYKWENNGYLFTHGDKAVDRLPLLFATEGKEVFKETDNHHIILGHLHHNKSKQFVNDRAEYNGIEVRVVGSPTSNDVWHKQNGFCQNKKALVGFIYTEEGKVAEYNYKI